MPDFYVAINRNKVTAASAQDAANLAVTTPLGPGDTSYVKELQASGSLFTIPGMRTTGVVGTVPSPDLLVTGATASADTAGIGGNTVLPPPPPMPPPGIPLPTPTVSASTP